MTMTLIPTCSQNIRGGGGWGGGFKEFMTMTLIPTCIQKIKYSFIKGIKICDQTFHILYHLGQHKISSHNLRVQHLIIVTLYI